jgi:hypothetical protein
LHPAGRQLRAAAGVCLLVAASPGFAQTAAPPDYGQSIAPPLDPFSPKPTLWSEPFQPYKPKRTTPSKRTQAPDRTLVPVPSGAGKTGFEASNRRKPKASNAKPGRPDSIEDSAVELPLSSIGPSISAASPKQALAQAPDTPPLTNEIGPIRKLPSKRKAHAEPEDPYQQIGLRAGAFDFYPAVELIGGYSSNPGQSSTPRGAAVYSVAPELRVQSRWVRHEITADLRGSYTGYSPDETPAISRPYFNGKVDGRLDVSHSIHVDGEARALMSTDNPGSPNVQAGIAKLPVFTTYGGSLGATKTFNRLELTLKGDAERTVYQDSVLTDGTTSSNKDRQYNQFGGTFRTAYELSPEIKPFVEAGLDTRRHDLAVDSFGYERDSNGETASVGASFKLRSTLAGEASIGYARRDYADQRFDRLAGLIGNASLIWTVDALNTVKFTGSSVIGESAVPGVSGVFYRDAAVQLDHAFRLWLIGTLKVGTGLDTYKGSCDCLVSVVGSNVVDRIDHRYFAALGLTYKFNRTMQLKGEFRQDWLRSNIEGSDYTASTFLVGLRLQR